MSATVQLPSQKAYIANEPDLTSRSFIEYLDVIRETKDPIIRAEFFCKEMNVPTSINFLEAYSAVDYTSLTEWDILRRFQQDYIIKLSNAAPITIAGNASAVLPIFSSSSAPDSGQNTNGNISVAVGEGILFPNTNIGKVTAKSTVLGSPTITVLNQSSEPVTLEINAEVILVPGQSLLNCECPSGKARLSPEPLLEKIGLYRHSMGFSLCGDDLQARKMRKFKYKVIDANNQEVEVETYAHEMMINTLKDFELGKSIHMYFGQNPATNFRGIIPQLEDKAIRWDWASPNVLDDVDIDVLIQELNENAFDCREYTFFVGQLKYNAAQKYMRDQAQGKVSYACYDPTDMCKHLNLNFCSFEKNGLKLCFILDKTFSNGKGLGAKDFSFPSRGIGMPMENRESSSTTRSCDVDAYKAITIVYFRGLNGETYDMFTDSTGLYGKRQNQGAGCTTTDYSFESRFAVEVHCPYNWILLGF